MLPEPNGAPAIRKPDSDQSIAPGFKQKAPRNSELPHSRGHPVRHPLAFQFFRGEWSKLARGRKRHSISSTRIVFSKSPLQTPAGALGTACSLELLLRQAASQNRIPFSVFRPPTIPVGSWSGSGPMGYWSPTTCRTHSVLKRLKFDVDHAFQEGKLLLVTMSSGPGGTVVYLDGRQAKVFPRFHHSGGIVGRCGVGIESRRRSTVARRSGGMAVYAKELTAAEVSKHDGDWNLMPSATQAALDGATAFTALTKVRVAISTTRWLLHLIWKYPSGSRFQGNHS